MSYIHVVVNLYSGRENPSWDLDQVDARRFVSLFAGLPEIHRTLPSGFDGLGYQGLEITWLAGNQPHRVQVFNGVVASIDLQGKVTQMQGDSDRSLERWVLDTGKKSLEPKLLEQLHLWVR